MRSVQSMMRDSTSTPMTSTRLYCPARMKASAIDSSVQEPRAGRGEVEGAPAAARAELLLHEGRGGREWAVAGDRPDDDAVDLAPARPRAFRQASRAASVARSLAASDGSRMCRSRMPVRSTIQASEVSTILREVVVGQHPRGDRRGRYRRCGCAITRSPPPKRGAGGAPSHRNAWRADRRGQLLAEADLREAVGDADGVLHRHRVRAAVADERDAVDPEQRRAAVLRVVHAPTQPLERPGHQRRAELRQQARARHLLAHHAENHLRRPPRRS